MFCRASALHLLTSLTVARRQPIPPPAALPAAPDANMDIAALQALSNVHFREEAPGRNLMEEVSTGRPHRAAEPAASGDSSVEFQNMLDGLVGGRPGGAGADVGDAATPRSEDRLAARAAAQASGEPELMVKLLRLCADWLRAPPEPEQGSAPAPREPPGVGAVCTALTVLCVWAGSSAEPAGNTEQHTVDAMLQLAQTVAAAYAACGGAEPDKAHAPSLGGGNVSEETEQVMAVDLVQQLASILWADPAHSDVLAHNHFMAVRGALVSGLLRSLSSLPPLRGAAEESQSSDAACTAAPAAAASGAGSLLASDGSLNWAAAQTAADTLDVRATYAGLGVCYDRPCGSQASPAAVPRPWMALLQSVEIEPLAAAMIVAASRCAVRPAGPVTAPESADNHAKPLDAAETADDAASDSLLGALFAEDPDDGAVDDFAGTEQFRTHSLSVFGDNMERLLLFSNDNGGRGRVLCHADGAARVPVGHYASLTHRAAVVLSSLVSNAPSRQQLLDVAAAALQLLGMTWCPDVHEDLQQRLNCAAASLLEEVFAVAFGPPVAERSARQVKFLGHSIPCMPQDALLVCVQS